MPCIFEDCGDPGVHNLGVRLRRSDTTAIWAPNTNAMVCNYHAGRGMRIIVQLESIEERVVETRVHSVARIVTRTTDIEQMPE